MVLAQGHTVGHGSRPPPSGSSGSRRGNALDGQIGKGCEEEVVGAVEVEPRGGASKSAGRYQTGFREAVTANVENSPGEAG